MGENGDEKNIPFPESGKSGAKDKAKPSFIDTQEIKEKDRPKKAPEPTPPKAKVEPKKAPEPPKKEPEKPKEAAKPAPEPEKKKEPPPMRVEKPPEPKKPPTPAPQSQSKSQPQPQAQPAPPPKIIQPGGRVKTLDLVNHWLKEMVERRASDLHIRAGSPLILRIDGDLISLDKNILSADMAKAALYSMLPIRQRKIFEVKSEVDFSYALQGVGRFRANAFKQRGSVAMVLRQIPTKIPNFSELQLPSVMSKFGQLSRGLVLVCGPTGSGKSTSLAALIQYINEDRPEHIVTVEDPIEFLYRDTKSIISQRELGSDTISFSEALKHVLRQDPDVILLGEMRDLETTSTAITAAQTGHLVFSTLHTTDAVQTINRIVDLYPPHQQMQIRLQMADVLRGVICQRLIPHAQGHGRVPACEVLVATALVKKAIAENQMQDVSDAIRQGKYYGMQTFHQALLDLYKQGKIKLDDALEAASNPEELMMAVRGITSGTEGVA